MPEQHKPCYGQMFPKTLAIETDKLAKGKAFSMLVGRRGGILISRRSVTADVAQWDDCVACEEFDHCYRLCLAKLSLEIAAAEK